MSEKTITITVTKQQIDALSQLVFLGSQNHQLSHEDGVFTDEEQAQFETEVEDPGCELVQTLENAFNS